MPTVAENRTQPAHPARVNDYDSFAEAYTAESDSGIQNAYYERPGAVSTRKPAKQRRARSAPLTLPGRSTQPIWVR